MQIHYNYSLLHIELIIKPIFLSISHSEYGADFYDACNLYKLVYRHKGEQQGDKILRMACDQFTKMVCQIYEATDYYSDKGSSKKFKILNFSTFPPESIGTFVLPEDATHNICCAKKPNSLSSTKKALLRKGNDISSPDSLLISCGTSGIIAHTLGSKTFHWGISGGCFRGMKKEMCAEAITTDGKERLFVVDSANKCIHTFSLDGFHVGILVKQGLLGVGTPRHVAWCSNTSSLVIVHDNGHAKSPMSKISILSLK